MALLEQYSSSKIRHPSWRVYKAVSEVRRRFGNDITIIDGLSLEAFCLKQDIDIYYPYDDTDGLTEQLIDALTTPNYKNDALPIADTLCLFLDATGRQYLESLLMTGMTPYDTSDDTGYSMEFIQTYSSLFYDVTVWRTHADKQNYLNKATIGVDRATKLEVDKNGLDYAKAKIFRVASKIKVEQAVLNLFAESYKQAMHYMHTDSPEDQEVAQGWTKLTIATYKELKNINQSDGGIKELTIALQSSPAPKIGINDLK